MIANRTVAVLAVVGQLLPLCCEAASAAPTVRRHLHCNVTLSLTPTGGSIIPDVNARAIVITNNWSLTIPKGTTYTITADRRTSSYKSGKALGPGQTLTVGGYGTISTCNVSVPG